LTKSTYKSPVAIDPSDWITQAEAARLRHVTRQAIARLVENGRLRTLDIGGRSFVNRAEVLSFEPNPPGRPKATNHG
jgi:excisionase family DNA binding protein